MEHTTATLGDSRWIFAAAGSAILGYCDLLRCDEIQEVTNGKRGLRRARLLVMARRLLTFRRDSLSFIEKPAKVGSS